MKITRNEITTGVYLNHLQSNKFKTACISFSLLTQLNRENAFKNALIPYVLRRGTSKYNDIEAISTRLDNLYGSVIEPVVRRIGEIQCIGLYSSFPENKYIPNDDDVLHGIVSLICEMILSPLTRGGLLIPDYVESEKKKLSDQINSRINEKRSYSISRCAEIMCEYEDYSAGRCGRAEDANNVNYKKLTKHYHNLVSESPVEIFYCGSENVDTVLFQFRNALTTMPRGEINYDIGTDIRMNSFEESVRYYEECLDVTQGKLVLGYRLGECMEDPDSASLNVFNCVFGSGITSKLFMNVREKMSLCYYANSIIDKYKGIMLVASGIDFEKYEAAKDEILHQLDEIKLGNITDDELRYAKKGIISDLSAISDSPHDLESFYFSNIIQGNEYSPDELAYLVSEVSKEDIMTIAQSTVLDLIYFLRGNSDDED